MKFKPYPSYKDSGIEWLGKVPEHWEIIYSKWLFQERCTKACKDDEQLTASQKYGVIPQKEFMRLENKKVMQVIIGHQILKHVEPNDFVISMRSFQGGLEYCTYKGSVSSAYVPLRPKQLICADFFKYLFKSQPYVEALQSTSSLIRDGQALRYHNFIQVRLPNVPLEEQTVIGRFLKNETTRIDALVEEKNRFIELLKEKRRALISHAMTKGLDPTVKMKDSGVGWLGEVPEHWTVLAIKRLTNIGRGASPRPIDDPKYFDEDGEYLWTRISDVSAASVYLYDSPQKLSTLGASLSVKLEPESLFLSIAGTVGKACITGKKACIHDGFVYFPNLKQNSKYFFYIFECGELYKGLGKMNTQLNLNTETVGSIKIAIPSLQEQTDIVNFIDCETAKIDALISETQVSIELLKEHRTALISAAVTGKIDVREAA